MNPTASGCIVVPRMPLFRFLSLTTITISLLAAADHADTRTLFNGASLSGWKTSGAGEWRAVGGAIQASAKAGSGWLTLDRSYEDYILRFTFQCDACDAGILLRKAGTTGIYVPLGGKDIQTVYRATLDANENITDRKFLAAPKPRNSFATITDAGNGWKKLQITVRAEIAVDPPKGGGTAVKDNGPRFGQLALRIAAGEAKFKDLSLTDLTRPAMGLPPEITSADFRKIQLTDRFFAEGISAGDVNHDGVMDAVSGPFAYLGPDFHRTLEIYPPQTYNFGGPGQHGTYTDSFLNYVHDFNGDGWPDNLKINFQGAYLYINPKGESRHWAEYEVAKDVSSETTQLVDVDGDGKLELLLTHGRDPDRVLGYAKPDPADPTKPWAFHAVSTKGPWGGHGMGAADINGDGKVDILCGAGWFQQPAAGAASGTWEFHAVPFGRGTDPFVRGSDILAYDVNADGLPDVISSMFSHGPGLAWFEQKKATDGTISFTTHMIMDDESASPAERKAWEVTDKTVAFSELHAISLVDMDGDGLKDIVTGKRWWSHGIEYPENDLDHPPVMYWFKLSRKAGKVGNVGKVEWIPRLINNFSAVGTQIAVVDMNGDGKPDVLTAQRKGAFIFLNQMKK